MDKGIWLKDLYKLEGLLPFAENKAFRAEWAAIKQRNKERLAHYVQTTLGLTISTDAMFDVQIKVRVLWQNVLLWVAVERFFIKRIHEYKVFSKTLLTFNDN